MTERVMLLLGQRGNAVHPFPCPITIQARTNPPKENGDEPEHFYAVVCGDGVIMAKYHDLAPAKMEINRAAKEWEAGPEHLIFQFVKDPWKEEDAE